MHKIKAHIMCKEISRLFPNLDPRVLEALESVKREDFVPSGFSNFAYSLDPLPIAQAQWISSPLTVAKMTHYLTPGDSVLEIGCGSGYQAMVLSKIFRRVFSIERIEELLLKAREAIRKSGVTNISTKWADGVEGWKEYAPYDRILFSACIDGAIPNQIVEQLSDRGIIVAPIKEKNNQVIKRFTKINGALKVEVLESCLFVPVLNGVVSHNERQI